MNIYIVYEIEKSVNISSSPTLEIYLFGAVKLTRHVDVGLYKYSRSGIGFDEKGFLSHPSGGTGKNVIIFGVDMSSATKTDNRKKDILILGKGSRKVLEHTLSGEKMYSIKFTKKKYKILLKLAL